MFRLQCGLFLTQDRHTAELGWAALGSHLETTRFDSIVFLAGDRHTAELGWAALGSHLETNIWHFAEVFATC